MVATTSAGDLLRSWRQRRRFSQRDLGARAASTARHIGDLESGQAAASHEMLIRLAEALSIPIRDRNALLTAAGYAPLYSDTAPDAPAFPRAALDEMLAAAEPNPAVAIDGHWTIQASNKAAWRLFAGVDPLLTSAPANLLRLCLHPAGLAPRIVNLREWRRHAIDRLEAAIDATGDPRLSDLVEEIHDFPLPKLAPARGGRGRHDTPVVPMQLVTIDGTLSLIAATTRFWPAVDAALSELTVETFMPADKQTRAILRAMAARAAGRAGSIVPLRERRKSA